MELKLFLVEMKVDDADEGSFVVTDSLVIAAETVVKFLESRGYKLDADGHPFDPKNTLANPFEDVETFGKGGILGFSYWDGTSGPGPTARTIAVPFKKLARF